MKNDKTAVTKNSKKFAIQPPTESATEPTIPAFLKKSKKKSKGKC